MPIEHLGPEAADLLSLSNAGEARSLNRLAEMAAWQVPACAGAHATVWRDGEVVAPPRMTYVSHDAPQQVRTIYRDAIDAALKRCTPLHFSEGMGGAVAGRPIAIRFVDDRTIDNGANPQ